MIQSKGYGMMCETVWVDLQVRKADKCISIVDVCALGVWNLLGINEDISRVAGARVKKRGVS